MKIKEMEERSQMTRANIRFYESEGFLSPKREENGYREYSESDLEILLRIKLLRSLHFSLEEIKEIHNGNVVLTSALNQQLAKLEAEKENIEYSEKICRNMRDDGVNYQTLDAKRYLNAIEPIVQKSTPEYEEDVIPKVRSPWRRFFARRLDYALYYLIWSMVLALVFHVNLGNPGVLGQLSDAVVPIILMILIEPFLLSVFGTTFGKWILGLRVTSYEDRRLTYAEAWERTVNALWYGLGFYIPIYCWIRLWKSYKDCSDGDTLSWECDSTMYLKDKKAWRIGVGIGTYVLYGVVLFLTIRIAALPKNRGDLTVAEFCENYNELAEYYAIDGNAHLSETGKWIENESDRGVVIYVGGSYERPECIFTEQDGVMTGVQFSVEQKNSDIWPSNYQDEMILLILSFMQAQKEYNPFGNGDSNLIEKVQQAEFQDFSFTEYGVTVTCEVEYSGYLGASGAGVLIPEDDGKNYYKISFSMEKE